MTNYNHSPQNDPESNQSSESKYDSSVKRDVNDYLSFKKKLEDLEANGKGSDKKAQTIKSRLESFEDGFSKNGVDINEAFEEIKSDEVNDFLKIVDKLKELRAKNDEYKGYGYTDKKTEDEILAAEGSYQHYIGKLQDFGIDTDEVIAQHEADLAAATAKASINPGSTAPTDTPKNESTPQSPENNVENDDAVKAMKYDIMRSEDAQNAFLNGGEAAYIQFIEDEFHRINNEYGVKTPGTELAIPSKEVDIYGNAVQHQLEWSRNGEQTPATYSKELVPVEGEPTDKSKELVPVNSAEFELPADFAERIKVAADQYALATAKDRHSSFFVGRYSKDPQSAVGRLLHKIPGFGKMRGFAVDQMDKIGAGDNKNHTEKIDQLRQNYEMQITLAKEALDKLYADQNVDPTKMLITKAHLDGMADLILEQHIVDHRHNESSDSSWLTEWWVSQDDAKFGKYKKAAAIVGVGIAAGAVGTFAAPVVGALSLGGVAGGLAGGIVANAVGKSRANAKGYQVDENGKFIRNADGEKVKHEKTIAERQSEEDVLSKKDTHDAYVDEVNSGERTDEFQTTWNTEDVEARTTSEVKRNRDRIKRAKALGGLAGGLTGLGLSSLARADFNGAPVEAPKPDVPPTPEAAPPAPEVPHLNGEQFVVERGSGYTKELMQFAQANGHNLNPTQSFQLHEYLISKFGPDYMNIQGTGGHDVYKQAGDIRLSAPGNAEWVKGVTAEAQKWMTGRGLW